MTPYLEQPFILILSAISLTVLSVVIGLSMWKNWKTKPRINDVGFNDLNFFNGIGLAMLCLFLWVKLIIQMVSVFSN